MKGPFGWRVYLVPGLHSIVGRSSAALRANPVDILREIFDVTRFTVNTVLCIDQQLAGNAQWVGRSILLHFRDSSFLLCVKKIRRFLAEVASTHSKIKQKGLYCRVHYCLNRKKPQKRLIRYFRGHFEEKIGIFRIFKTFQEKTPGQF